MEVNRYLECFGAFQNRPEELVVEVAALGMAADHCPLEAVFTDHALQLVGGSVRSRGRQVGESGKTARVAPHRVRDDVVYIAGHLY